MSALMNRFRRKDAGETNEEYIRRLNYDELEEKYDIHKYYPQYIHNGEVSTPQLRAMIKDKPIYHGVKPRAPRPTDGENGLINRSKINGKANGSNMAKSTSINKTNGTGVHKPTASTVATATSAAAATATTTATAPDSIKLHLKGGPDLTRADEHEGYAERRGTLVNGSVFGATGSSTKTEPISIPMANGNTNGSGLKIGNLFRNPFKELGGGARSFDQSKSEMTMRRKLENKEESEHMRRNSIMGSKGKPKGGVAQAPPSTRAGGSRMSRVRGMSGASSRSPSGEPGLAAAQGKGTYIFINSIEDASKI